MAVAGAVAEPPAPRRGGRPITGRRAGLGIALAPALLIAYLAFRAGGYHPDGYGSAAALMAFAVGGGALASKSWFRARFSPALIVAIAALSLLVAWTWLSSQWSSAPAGAVFETPRAALYLLTLVFFGSFLPGRRRLALATAGVAAAMAVVCAAALATELFPDVFPTSPPPSGQRLAFPLGYWNSLGLFAAIAIVLLFHLTSDLSGPRAVRVAAAMAVPVPAVTLYFTFSRGAVAALVVGFLAYLAVARCRGVVAGLIATAAATAPTLAAAYSAELLSSEQNRTAAAAAEGHGVALWLLAGCVVGAVLRIVLRPLDERLARMRPASPRARTAVLAGAVIAAMLAFGAAAALNAPARVHSAYESFTEPEIRSDARSRFRQVTLSGRQEHWDVALDHFGANPLTGEGAGTFGAQWLRSRPSMTDAREAHSLYIEALAELGIVGCALIVTALGAMLLGLLARTRDGGGPLYGALFAAMLMWAGHAGVDWDWELPAVGLGLFALAGMGLSRRAKRGARSHRLIGSWPIRIGVASACVLIAVTGIRTVIADASLEEAKRDLEAGRCRDAIRTSRTALSAVASDPVGHEVIGWCLIDARRPAAAVGEMERAVKSAPDHWRFRYGLAVARAAAGVDPFRDLRRARQLNPQGALLVDGAGREIALTPESEDWKRLARSAIRPAGVGDRP